MMQTEVILEVPEGRQTLIPKKDIVYKVPMEVMVYDAGSMELLNVQEITLELAPKVILIPKVAGG